MSYTCTDCVIQIIYCFAGLTSCSESYDDCKSVCQTDCGYTLANYYCNGKCICICEG